jgi:hypothetical protein
MPTQTHTGKDSHDDKDRKQQGQRGRRVVVGRLAVQVAQAKTRKSS